MENEPKNINPETFLSNAGIEVKGILIDIDPGVKVDKNFPKEGEIKQKIDSGRIHLGE